jgi:hypothetical protein
MVLGNEYPICFYKSVSSVTAEIAPGWIEAVYHYPARSVYVFTISLVNSHM